MRIPFFARNKFSPRLPNTIVGISALNLANITKDGSDLVDTVVNLGSAGNATQSTALRKPKYIASVPALNNRPAFQGRHDGTNASCLAIADSAAFDVTQFTLVVVGARAVDTAASEHMAGKFTTNGNQREFRLVIDSSDRVQGTSTRDGTSGTAVVAAVTGAVAVNTGFMGILTQDAANIVTTRNGVNTATAAQASLFNGTGEFSIFSRPSADAFAELFAGYISEVWLYGRKISTTEMLYLEKGFQKIYGVPYQ